MRPHNGAMPAVDEVGRGDVKTPPLWHTAAKIPSGRWYSDGSFHGEIPLMASSMELEKDRSFDALVAVVIPRIKAGIRRLWSGICGRRRIRTRSIAALAARGQGAVLFGVDRLLARAMVSTTAAETSTGPACTAMSAPIDRGSTSCRRASSTRSTPARSRPQGALVKSRRLRGDAADRRLGQLSLPPQRQRADAASPAGPGLRAAGDLRSDGVAILDRVRVGQPLFVDPALLAHARSRTCCAALAAIGTGSTRGGPARATPATTCGRSSRATRTDAR